MKTSIYLIVCFLSFSFFLSSCKLEGKDEANPAFMLSRGDIIKNSKDSIWFSPIVENGAYLLDSIAVGDTLLFKLRVTGVFNPIKQLKLSLSDNHFAELIYISKDSLDRIFSGQSKYDEGLFLLDTSFDLLYFPFQVHIKKAAKNIILNLFVQTDASLQFNSNSLKIKMPILPPKEGEVTE